MSNTDLEAQLEELIKDYEKWIHKEIPLNSDWTEEIEYLSFTRSEIHDLLQKMTKEDLNYGNARVKKLDQKWQAWIIKNKDIRFKLEHPRDSSSKSNWWNWVDQLEKLSSSEKSTL